MAEDQLTLDNYVEHVLKPIFAKCAEKELVLLEEWKKDLIFYGWKQPTRKERFKARLKNYKQRAKDIWTILSGGDIHSDCGDY